MGPDQSPGKEGVVLSKPDDQPRFDITFRVLPDESDPDGTRRLRALLKFALRRLRLRCTKCE